MSNQYYNFLSRRLLQWINKRKDLRAGDKYFVLMDNLNEVENFYKVLETTNFEGKSVFEAETYNYSTVELKKNEVRVIFVAPINGITQDFLVTIRNKVNANLEEFRNTAVFFIVHDALDSIIGGAFDVSQKDAPFHVQTIRNEIKKEIDSQNSLSNGKKKALELYLGEITANSHTILKDYETVFSILEKGNIGTEDFNMLGFFPDHSLDTIPKNAIEERLKKNHNIFEKVESLHDFLDVKDRLRSEMSGENLIRKLSRLNEWKEVNYSDIDKGIHDYNKENETKLNFDKLKMSENPDNQWLRLEGSTSTKSKKLHIILSSCNITNTDFSFEVYFDDILNKSSIVEVNTFIFEGHKFPKKDFEVITKGKKLICIINNFNKHATYGGLLRYKHKGLNKLTFNIYFMVVPFALDHIKKLRPNFEIEILKSKKEFYFGISPEVNTYEFGENIKEEKEIESLEEIKGNNLMNSRITLLDSVFNEEENGALRVNTRLGQSFFPITFLDLIEKPLPVSPIRIEKKRLENPSTQFIFEDNKIMTGSSIISLDEKYKELLIHEESLTDYKSLYGEIISNRYVPLELEVPVKLKEAYNELFEYYHEDGTLPSIAVSDDRHISILQNVMSVIDSLLAKELQEGEKVAKEISNLTKIGTIIKDESIWLTPLHPLMIAYQIELYKQLEDKESIPKENILSTLNPQYLMPYMKLQDKEYQSAYSRTVPRWLFFNRMQERQLSNLATKIITHRLDDYITQYKFLFETNSNMAINIAAIRISDQVNFFSSVIEFVLKRIEEVNSLDEINPINIYFDKIELQSDILFQKFYEVNDIEALNALIGNTYKVMKFEDYEVLETLQKKVNVYRLPDDKAIDEIGVFFHIAFYQFAQRKELSIAKMDKLGKNYSLNGLVNNPQFYKEIDTYASGFGIGSIQEENKSDLIIFTSSWNSLIASSNKETDIYRKGDTLINNVPELGQNEITPLLKSSSWVTLLNLDVDLSYFFDDSNGEILVIHYTDQNMTSQYESVTVTKDIEQYERLLKENLLEGLSERLTFDTKEVIKNFNVINGQWLLKLISNKAKKKINSNYIREKLSIISSYKLMLGILEHPHFYWIPISLEEILRVSGMVGLSQKEGLFSVKNLGQSGATSDDLLFIGIDLRSSRIKLHYLPVEVKVGNNNSGVTEKAFKQVEHTSIILKQFLGEENKDLFMREFYNNFFVSILLANLEKMISSGIFTTNHISNYQNIKDSLVVGEYDISYQLEEYYGQGVVFEFSTNQTARTASLISTRNTFLIKVPENDAYNVVADKTTEIVRKIQSEEFDFHKEILLATKAGFLYEDSNQPNQNATTDSLNNGLAKVEDSLIDAREESCDNIKEKTQISEDSNEHVDSIKDTLNEDENNYGFNKIIKPVFIEKGIENKRIYLGKTSHTGHKIFWEYGNKKLANRHLLVTGKSGQGKTYFVQTLLSELVKMNIDSLVIDYTDGFLPNQLDPTFLDKYEEKVKNRFIFRDQLPINPFKRHEIDLGGFVIPETEQDMVDRIVQVIDFVFDLGIQQRTLLSETILKGYRENGDSYRFSYLADELRYSENRALENLYGRISTLLNRDPFSYQDDFDWDKIFCNEGKVNIFQLKGFQLNVQKVLIEFLLWDIFQYATRKGSEEKPLPLILDEVQNLDFSQFSPAVKILREGRKFGISGIFATQSIDSIKGNDAEAIYNTAEQLHFLPPDSQISVISRLTAANNNDRKEVESLLKTLRKGEAIVYGPEMMNDKSLSGPRIQKVKISSFEER